MSSQDGGRLVLPTVAELVDRLTIDQIKEVLVPEGRQAISEEIARLEHDIDLVWEESATTLSTRLVRIIVVIAQINVHIWYNKDRMTTDPDNYSSHLNVAHQLNSVRNRMKNLLLLSSGDLDTAGRHTNMDPRDLKAWEVSI